MDSDNPGLTYELERLLELSSQDGLTIGQLIENVSVKEYALAAFVVGVPFVLPVPLPGLSFLFGILLILIGIAIVFDRHVWLPLKWRGRKIPRTILENLVKRMKPWSIRLSKVIRARYRFLAVHRTAVVVNGALISAGGFFLALPLPPGTNFPPGLLILTLSLGMLEEDGILIGISYFIFILNCFFFGGFFQIASNLIRFWIA